MSAGYGMGADQRGAGGDRRFKRKSRVCDLVVAWALAILVGIIGFLIGASAADARARIKDLVEFEGVRGNDLVGYGLVVGLNGSGDSLRNAPYTEEALRNLLERLGVQVQGDDFSPRNVAAVVVTATLPPFARAGARIDIGVAAVGDARSLLGGTLIMTPLNGADGQIYAVAQGPIISGGVEAQGAAAEETQGVPTSGTVPSGARVEREIAFDLDSLTTMRLALRDPDFTTALRIEQAINGALGNLVARMLDPATVELELESAGARSPAHLIAHIENLTVRPEQRARVVVDHRSGTIVLGSNVKISEVAVSQGNLTIRVTERPEVSQPSPFSETGETVVVPRTDVEINQDEGANIGLVGENVTLADLVSGLNALGVGPRGMIEILEAIKAAGALHADFIVQ